MFYVHIDVILMLTESQSLLVREKNILNQFKKMVVLVMVILEAAECDLTTLLVPVLTA